MQTWTLSADDGTLHDPLDDPTQRIRPTMRGDGTEVVWLPEDGQVAQVLVEGFTLKYTDLETVTQISTTKGVLYVTDRRVVLVIPDVDPGLGAAGSLADVLTFGTSGTLRDFGRAIGGRTGLREKFHMVGQIDYLSLQLVRYWQTKIWGTTSTLDLGALTGDPAPRVLELLATRLPRKTDVASVATDIHTRARRAHLHDEFGVLDDARRQSAIKSAFERSGDGYIALLDGTTIPMVKLHELTGGDSGSQA